LLPPYVIGNSDGKTPPFENRRRWEDNIKTDIKETGCKGLEWIITGTGKHGNKHTDCVKGGQLLGYVSDSYILKKDSASLFLNSACNGAA
jgi:hypothetical protein